MASYEETMTQIDGDVKGNGVVLYMKGDKDFPMCGFSGRAVQILNAVKADYVTRNVLEDDTLREAIKEYSNWPTIPQLYIKGEFQGGCDIVKEMFQDGSLMQVFEEKGVPYDKSKVMTA